MAGIILLLPLFFTLLFGMVYEQSSVKHIPMAIYDESQSSASRNLITCYDNSEKFDIVTYVSSQEEMEEAVLSDRVMAALAIPKNFARDMKNGDGANVLLIVNSANNMYGSSALSASLEIARSFTISAGSQVMESAGLLPQAAVNAVYPVHMGVRILGNPTASYRPFMLTGLMLNGLQIGIMLTITPLLITELIHGRTKKYPAWMILAGRVPPYWILGMTAYTGCTLICVYLFDIPMEGSWFDVLVLGGIFLYFLCGFFMVFSAVCPDRTTAIQSPMAFIMPSLLYSGLSWPVFDMSTSATLFRMLLPLTYCGEELRDILLNGMAPELGSSCLHMFLVGTLGFIIGGWLFEKRRSRMGKEGSVHAGDTSSRYS